MLGRSWVLRWRKEAIIWCRSSPTPSSVLSVTEPWPTNSWLSLVTCGLSEYRPTYIWTFHGALRRSKTTAARTTSVILSWRRTQKAQSSEYGVIFLYCILKINEKVQCCVRSGQIRSGQVFIIQLLSAIDAATNSLHCSLSSVMVRCHLLSSRCFPELGYTGSSKVFFNTVRPSLRWPASRSFPLGCHW